MKKTIITFLLALVFPISHILFLKSATDTSSWFNGGCFGLQWRLFWTSMETFLDFNGGRFEA